MKRVSLTYPVWLVLVGGCAVMTFARINKHNFYHHYYRVIEEVQTRNSQEWEGAALIQIFSAREISVSDKEGPSEGTGLTPVQPILIHVNTHLPELPTRILRTVWYLNAHPAQAP